MKKLFARIGAIVAEWTLSFGVGFAWGTLLRKTIGKWLEDEENLEKHPTAAFWLAILYFVLLLAMPVVWAFCGPAMWIHDKLNGLIDKHIPDEEDEFEK